MFQDAKLEILWKQKRAFAFFQIKTAVRITLYDGFEVLLKAEFRKRVSKGEFRDPDG